MPAKKLMVRAVRGAKRRALNETHWTPQSLTRRFAPRLLLTATMLESMKVLRGYVQAFSVHAKDWLSRKRGTLSSLSRLMAGDSASAKLEEDFKNISMCILSFSTAVGVDTNLAVKKMAAKKVRRAVCGPHVCVCVFVCLILQNSTSPTGPQGLRQTRDHDGNQERRG